MPFKVGDILLRKYRLDKFLGLGGFSEVWKCHDLDAKQDLAVKIFLKQDEQGVTLCREEYAKMSKLRHPHILRPSFFTAEDGIPYLFMPFCEPGTALTLMGKLDEYAIAKLMHQIGSALEYIHNRQQPILHNDLKPDNFLIEDNGDYLLTDFGISDQLNQRLAREQDEERRTLVKAEEERKGLTPKAYRAPELFKKKNTPELPPVKASDIWSFGASVYQLITGEPPFDKDGGGQQRVYYEVNPQIKINEIVESLPQGYSPVLEQLLLRCLAFHPWDRPTAQELVKAAALFMEKGVWEDKSVDPATFYISDAAVHFGKVPLQQLAVQSLTFTTANMSGLMNINTTPPFAISLDGQNFTSNIAIDLPMERKQHQMYVHFSPPDPGPEQGVVSFNWNGVRQHSIEVSGRGRGETKFPIWLLAVGGAISLAVIVFMLNRKPEVITEEPRTTPPSINTNIPSTQSTPINTNQDEVKPNVDESKLGSSNDASLKKEDEKPKPIRSKKPGNANTKQPVTQPSPNIQKTESEPAGDALFDQLNRENSSKHKIPPKKKGSGQSPK